MPGSPFPQQQIRDNLDRAIAEGRVEDAWGWARGLRQVGLDQALALTVLLGRSGDGRYLRAATASWSASSARSSPRSST